MSEQQGQGQAVFQDRVLRCVDCGQEFTWGVEDQEYFHEQGFANEPKRCLPCRRAKKQRYADVDARKGSEK